jgi:endonuclease-8
MTNCGQMPEGDALHRAAQRLQALVGEVVEADSPNPQAQVKRIAERLDGRRLESVEAVGKNLLLRFESGLVLRSHLKMKGRWWVQPRGRNIGDGKPWLVLRSPTHEAVLWHGPVLELDDTVRRRLGPDILGRPLATKEMLRNLRALPQDLRLGEVLQAQRAVAGIGNMWMAEALWDARLSPWLRLDHCSDEELLTALESAATLMHRSLDEGRGGKRVHRRAGRPCARCGAAIRSRPMGDAARTAYWCPECQRGEDEAAP